MAEQKVNVIVSQGWVKKESTANWEVPEVWTLLFPQTGTKIDIFWYCPHERKYDSKSGIEMATFDFTVCTYYTIYCTKMEVVRLALA